MKLKEMDQELKNDICSRIQFNIKEEASASEYYFELLNDIAEEDKQTIKDIIADELNHAIILGKLQEKYSGIYPSEYNSLISLKKVEK